MVRNQFFLLLILVSIQSLIAEDHLDKLQALPRASAAYTPYAQNGRFFQDSDQPLPRERYTGPTTIQGHWVEYDYEHSFQNPSGNKVSIGVKIFDKNLIAWKDKVYAKVTYRDLSDCEKSHQVEAPVTMGVDGKAVIDVSGLKAGSVFDFEKIDFYGKGSSPDDKPTKLSSMHTNYMGATIGDGKGSHDEERVLKARFQIVTSALQESHERSRGRFSDANANYMKQFFIYSNGACGMQQASCALPFIRSYNEDQSNAYAYRGKLLYGSELDKLARLQPVHGNYYMNGAHKGTIIAYCKNTKKTWTIDGGFNQATLMTHAYPNFSQIGVITAGMLYPEKK